jgi:hypothetical protein
MDYGDDDSHWKFPMTWWQCCHHNVIAQCSSDAGIKQVCKLPVIEKYSTENYVWDTIFDNNKWLSLGYVLTILYFYHYSRVNSFHIYCKTVTSAAASYISRQKALWRDWPIPSRFAPSDNITLMYFPAGSPESRDICLYFYLWDTAGYFHQDKQDKGNWEWARLSQAKEGNMPRTGTIGGYWWPHKIVRRKD